VTEKTKENLQVAWYVFLTIAAIQGAYLGFKASFGAGLDMLVTTISPIVTGLVYWCTLGSVDLARWGFDFYISHIADGPIPGLIVLAGFAVICYALLATWFKIITMFARK